ncbi:MAG: hypothetical protein KAS23_16985 [Anaerohalosphaera sp.]|nr:hypothetical protein [Anaerohalosphaera sp.]
MTDTEPINSNVPDSSLPNKSTKPSCKSIMFWFGVTTLFLTTLIESLLLYYSFVYKTVILLFGLLILFAAISLFTLLVNTTRTSPKRTPSIVMILYGIWVFVLLWTIVFKSIPYKYTAKASQIKYQVMLMAATIEHDREQTGLVPVDEKELQTKYPDTWSAINSKQKYYYPKNGTDYTIEVPIRGFLSFHRYLHYNSAYPEKGVTYTYNQ